MRVVSAEGLDVESVLDFFEDVVVVPTETVYGLAANIWNLRAVERIFALKGRPANNPLIAGISSVQMLEEIVEGPIPLQYKKLIENFWPGPLTLLFKSKDNVSPIVRGGLNTIAVRMPGSKLLLKIIERLGAPLVIPSANISGRPSPTTIEHVIEDFGDEVKLMIDGGPSSIGVESTIVQYVDGRLQVLRPGGITVERIKDVVDCEVIVKKNEWGGKEKRHKHYSPKSPLVLFKGRQEDIKDGILKYISESSNIARVGVALHSGMDLKIFSDVKVDIFDMGDDKKNICKNFFRGIRKLDKVNDIILVAGMDCDEQGHAIMDRLEKAADRVIEL
ncbi:translation factor [Encephalitozoon intestinalis ATCC 50506]|uniref:Threonylcarbamoyl-AMP synthase n=1 Tax=Encephalitozoon intestinalis (strain ATCC 50506) TaxID=876142 RepID=E0S934_ENCIT|nr:translation factor [Encephalitozoon intestinalis ATCC 50506]ADM12290.1 translation factor [Encephalitozoon intestinalis ATCC 50506]UTX46099.1 tRNA threonylcarbamoyl adenosine modification protein [Encephalitozoon intestinalis]